VKLEDALKTTKFRSPQQKASLNCLYTAWWLKTVIAQVLKPHGLTHEQYNVMRILKGKHPEQMCVRDIASRMMEKSSNVPRIIDRLVAKKWVERTTSTIDKRETVINLTGTGITVLEQSTHSVEKIFSKIETLTDAEAQQLNDLLERLRAKED